MPSCPCTSPLVPSRDRMKCITPCPWSLTFHTRQVCIPSLCPSLPHMVWHMVCHTWCTQFWACGPLLYGISVASSSWLSFHPPSNCIESSLILPGSSGFWHFTGGKNKTKQNTFCNDSCKIVGCPLFIFLGESTFKSTLLITMHTHAS